MTKYFALIVICAIGFTSCHHFMGERIRGTGNVRAVTRNGGNFTEIEVGSALELHVRQDSARSIKIETDENLQEYVIVENDGGTVHIYTERGFNLQPSNGNKVKVYVSSPVFTRLQASGASSIIGENTLSGDVVDLDLSGASDVELELKSPKVTLGMSGASSATLRGETKDLSIDGSGASHARCYELKAENIEVDVSGASSAEAYASLKVNATASGASNVRYKGDATVQTRNTSGASSIEKVN